MHFLNFSFIDGSNIICALVGLIKLSTTDLFIDDLITLLSKKNDDVRVKLISHNAIYPSKLMLCEVSLITG